MRHFWIPDDDARLAKMWVEGVPTPEVARSFGVTIVAVESRVRALKIRRPKAVPVIPDRRCCYCNAPLAKRDRESRTDYAKRRYCGRKCANLCSTAHLRKSVNASRQNRIARRVSKRQRAHINDLKARRNATAVAQPTNLSPGQVETIAAYLARGGIITRCPSAYAAPVEPTMREFPGVGVHRG